MPSTAPLPSDVPLEARSVLVQEYAGTLNTHAATVWFYTVIGTDATPASVIAFYESGMPVQGWTAIAVPSETAQGKYGGTALAYQQGSQYATIAAGLDSSYPHAVTLLITVAQ